MARYFLGDTRLAGWERMMMDPSRRPPDPAKPRRTRPQKKPPRGQQTASAVSKQKARKDGV